MCIDILTGSITGQSSGNCFFSIFSLCMVVNLMVGGNVWNVVHYILQHAGRFLVAAQKLFNVIKRFA